MPAGRVSALRPHTHPPTTPTTTPTDFARTNNINALVMGLWPSVSEAVTQQLVMQMAPQLMADMAKTYGAGVLTGLELLEFDLGDVSHAGGGGGGGV